MSKIVPIEDNFSERIADIVVHAQASVDLDHDHGRALDMKLREVTDEQLLAEVSRRNIDVHHSVSLDMVKKGYDFTKVNKSYFIKIFNYLIN